MADVAYASENQEDDWGDERSRFTAADLMRWSQTGENIAPLLSNDDLGTYGERIVREYEIDEASRSEKTAKWDAAMKAVMQITEAKNYPWPKASNVKFPLLTTAVMQYAARAYPAVVGQNDIVKGRVIGRDEGIPQLDSVTGQPLVDPKSGDTIFKVPPGAKRKKADRIAEHMSYQLIEEMEDWDAQTDLLLHVQPAYGCAFRKVYFSAGMKRSATDVLTPLELVVNNGAKSLERAPRITHCFELYPHEIEERVRNGTFRDGEYIAPQDGGDDLDAPHKFLEQHRWLDLDGDGYPEPYICTVHHETAEVARIVARFDPEGVTFGRGQEIVKIEPVQYFVKYPFVPSPDGTFYDLGFCDLLWPINDSVNTAINQMLDAGHLQNVGGGFIGAEAKMKSGDYRFKPGEWKRVHVPGADLAKSIVPLPFGGPSPVLFELLGLLIEAGNDIAAVKDVLTGDAQSANQSPTTTLALIEQGLKVFTAIYKRVFRSMKAELRLLWRLNRVYLPDEVYFNVLDDPRAIRRQDYDDDTLDVTPVADPSMVTGMQKIAKAELLLSLSGDPILNRKEILNRVFSAASIDDEEELFVEKPPPDPRLALEADKIEIEKEAHAIRREENAIKRQNMQIEAVKAEVEIGKIRAEIIKLLAEAEAAENGTQIEFYTAQMEALSQVEGVKTDRMKAAASLISAQAAMKQAEQIEPGTRTE